MSGPVRKDRPFCCPLRNPRGNPKISLRVLSCVDRSVRSSVGCGSCGSPWGRTRSPRSTRCARRPFTARHEPQTKHSGTSSTSKPRHARMGSERPSRPAPRPAARRVRTTRPLPDHPPDLPGTDQDDHLATAWQGPPEPSFCQESRRAVRRHEGCRSLAEDHPEPPRHHRRRPPPRRPLGVGPVQRRRAGEASPRGASPSADSLR